MNSSNYDPQDMWNVGAHMVALNYQTHSYEMNLLQAKFRDNGGVCCKFFFARFTSICSIMIGVN